MKQTEQKMVKIDPKKIKIGLNVSDQIIIENTERSIKRGLPQVQQHMPNPKRLVLVCGGPSLEDGIDLLKKYKQEGRPIVAFNNTHEYLQDNGIVPNGCVILDAREHNARFVKNPIPSCHYFLASQVHPAVYDALIGYNVKIFHAISIPRERAILEDYYMGHFYHVNGGSTVVLRGLSLFSLLGYFRFEIFGFDSCYMDGKHHPYKQKENDNADLLKVEVGGESFTCAMWMYSQAKDFVEMVSHIGQDWEMRIHGDGMISHIIKTAAKEQGDIRVTGTIKRDEVT